MAHREPGSTGSARGIVATGGHVDHGKTRLIEALTGIDCDRLAEEKRRGITIDLGFAHLSTAGVQIGFIDVPGHRRFLDNALAGLGGARILLLAVAATEGVMAQTREHLALASLLGIPAALVALTQIDLADPELVELARLDVAELLAGTPYAGSAILAVSSVTGCGLEELRRVLFELVRRHHVEADLEAPARLPIDRAFHLQGRGTVVTGTLASGAIRPGDTLEILRLQKRFRVRSVQVHGEDRERALAGERTSLLLAGADLSELDRGLQLVRGGAFELSSSLCAQLALLPCAPGPLSPRTDCRLHLLADEAMARASPLEPPVLERGECGLVEIRLRSPMPVVRGDRLILRRLSPAATLGGGEVVDPLWHRRRRRIVSDLTRLCGDSEGALSLWIEKAGPAGATAEDLAQRLGAAAERLQPCLDALVSSGKARELAGRPGLPRRWLAETVFAELRTCAHRLLTAHFERDRFSLGMCKRELLDRLVPGVPEAPAEMLLRQLAAEGAVELVEGRISLPGRVPELSEEEARCAETILARFRTAGLEPPTVAEIIAEATLDAETLEGLFRLLVARRQLHRLSNRELVATCAVEMLHQTLLNSGRARDTVPEFKELFGLTRKWAVPLLELCDTMGMTRKIGMDRLIVRPIACKTESEQTR